MTDKERFLMKLLLEYNWKDAFSDVKIPDKIEFIMVGVTHTTYKKCWSVTNV